MTVWPIAGVDPITAAERGFDLYQKQGSNPPPPLGPLVRLRREFLVLEVRARREGVLGARYGGKDGFTVGQLVSVEQAVLVEGGAKAQWRKAVSVDAGGKLPSWAQVVKGTRELVKEVGAFMECAAKERGVKELD